MRAGWRELEKEEQRELGREGGVLAGKRLVRVEQEWVVSGGREEGVCDQVGEFITFKSDVV